MFTNPVYNFPSKLNDNSLSQNFANLSLNNPSTHVGQQQQNLNFGSYQYSQQQQQQQQVPVDIGDYVPPSLNEPESQWSSSNDVNVSYQRGSTVVRQYNNSMIDDYYKKFLRPITEYVAIPTNGQPTYVYQNLGGQGTTTAAEGLTTQPTTEVNDSTAVMSSGSFTKADGTEEKKHKKKHKKRSSKHAHGESKTGDIEKAIEQIQSVANTGIGINYQQEASILAGQQEVVAGAGLQNTGAVGPQVPMRFPSNPVVFFDIDIDNEPRGRLLMELFRHVLPRTTQNFLSLTLNEHGFGYRLSYFHRVIPGFMAQGGDFEKSNGTGGYSIYGEKFEDEGFPYPHDRPGLLSMANSGPNTNGSQFFITFAPCPHLDNKHVVFGQVIQGFHLLKDLDLCGSDTGEVLREIKVANSGQYQ